MKYENVIEVDPEKLSGTPVFRGTRVPIQTFFDYLKDGESFEVFLDDFPTVSREQLVTLCEQIRTQVMSEYEAAA
jgi:uncharacterized protein (DUF433 family)